MSDRITRLETHFEYLQRDMAELKAGQKDILAKLDVITLLPTKTDLWSWKLQYTGLCVAAIALIVGGIVGGLGWIKPDAPAATPPAPVVITLPAPYASPAPSLPIR